MKRLFHCIIYFPAFITWIPFAISFRLANKLIPNNGEYSSWNWFGINAICKETYFLGNKNG
jgi:hypothetical protein